jgi:hypothetical protein
MAPVLDDGNESYSDKDLTFLVHTFHDSGRLIGMLKQLRSIFPQARLIVCSDGDDDAQLPKIASQSGAEFYHGENLYAQGHGGKICQRMLDLFLREPTAYFFKVDPDTGFHRRFAFLPKHSGMFGTLQSNDLLCSIQGGCCEMTLDWAQRMFEAKVFLREELKNPDRTWASHPALTRYINKVGRVSSDWIFSYIATAKGIPQYGFTEVCCRWKKPVVNRNLRFAITHPVNNLLSHGINDGNR